MSKDEDRWEIWGTYVLQDLLPMSLSQKATERASSKMRGWDKEEKDGMQHRTEEWNSQNDGRGSPKGDTQEAGLESSCPPWFRGTESSGTLEPTWTFTVVRRLQVAKGWPMFGISFVCLFFNVTNIHIPTSWIDQFCSSWGSSLSTCRFCRTSSLRPLRYLLVLSAQLPISLTLLTMPQLSWGTTFPAPSGPA